jgi:L-asparagine oxygenase
VLHPVLDSMIELSGQQAAGITLAADALCGSPYGEAAEQEAFIRTALGVMRTLPLEVLQALADLRSRRDHHGAVLVRGFTLQQHTPTPAHWAEASNKQTFESEGILLGAMLLLGEPFAFKTQQSGRLVQNVLPTRGMEKSQTNAGSAVFLEWHVEDAFTPWRGDFVGLFCLRSSPEAYTAYVSVDDINLPNEAAQILFQPRFSVRPDEAHTGFDDSINEIVSILYGDKTRPYIRYDPLYMIPRAQDLDAKAALQLLAEEIEAQARQVRLEEGDLLIFDNHRIVHGRTPFTPRFDGTDRWLQRLSVQSDYRELQIASRWGAHSRVIDPVASLNSQRL